MKKEEEKKTGSSGSWMPDFTPEERAVFVKLNGEDWVQREEEFRRMTRELMAALKALP